jgi:DHA1 family tetracycline resistance protein-like MFS transporter
LFGGSISTAQAYIADVVAPQERTKYMGLLGASIGMGFVFGPALGAGLSTFGFGTAAYVAAGLAALNFVFALVALPESRPPGMITAAPATARQGLLAALRQPNTGPILSATFLTTFAFVGMEATFALLGKERFGLGAGGLGAIFTFVGVIIAVVQGGLIGRLSARYGERTLAIAGIGMMALALLLLPWVSSLALALLVLAVLSIGQGLSTPTLSSLLARESGSHARGRVLGSGQSLAAAARAVGPLAAGALFDRGIALPYLLGGLLALVAIGALLRLVPSLEPTVGEVG